MSATSAVTGEPFVAEGVHDGILWRIRLSPFKNSANAYVQLPPGHPWADVSYESLDEAGVIAHGGLTYGPDGDGWLGFDTAHAWDVWTEAALAEIGGEHDPRFIFHLPGGTGNTYWSLNLLVSEVQNLAAQAALAQAVNS